MLMYSILACYTLANMPIYSMLAKVQIFKIMKKKKKLFSRIKLSFQRIWHQQVGNSLSKTQGYYS